MQSWWDIQRHIVKVCCVCLPAAHHLLVKSPSMTYNCLWRITKLLHFISTSDMKMNVLPLGHILSSLKGLPLITTFFWNWSKKLKLSPFDINLYTAQKGNIFETTIFFHHRSYSTASGFSSHSHCAVIVTITEQEQLMLFECHSSTLSVSHSFFDGVQCCCTRQKLHVQSLEFPVLFPPFAPLVCHKMRNYHGIFQPVHVSSTYMEYVM